MDLVTCDDLVADTHKIMGIALAQYGRCLGGDREYCLKALGRCSLPPPDPAIVWGELANDFPQAVQECEQSENADEIKYFLSHSRGIENDVLCRPMVQIEPRTRSRMNMGPILFLAGVAGLLLLIWLLYQNPESDDKSKTTAPGTPTVAASPASGTVFTMGGSPVTFKQY